MLMIFIIKIILKLNEIDRQDISTRDISTRDISNDIPTRDIPTRDISNDIPTRDISNDIPTQDTSKTTIIENHLSKEQQEKLLLQKEELGKLQLRKQIDLENI